MRHAARVGRNADQLKFAQRTIAFGHIALALKDVNLDRRLIVDDRGKRQAVPQWNCGIALDYLREETTARFQTEAERQYIQQHDIFHFARQDSALNGRAHRDNFVRINFH